MIKHLFAFSLLAVIFSCVFGCSSGGADIPTIPADSVKDKPAVAATSHQLRGIWSFAADPEAGMLDVVQLRDGDMHLNALRFLEPPAGVFLSIEGPPQFSGGNVTVDIGLRHPFLGQTAYTGFDVRGILISEGSTSGFNDPDLLIPGAGDTRLLNADGLTRWWNPTEFPPNPTQPVLGYIDGMLGTPDSIADYSATLNGYKYFADGLGIDDDVNTIDTDNRGLFSAGQKNVRRYVIDLDGGLIFNYAVDASWVMPTGGPPYHAPDDFPPNANAPECWDISVTEVENTLFNDGIESGGELHLAIDVFDWFNADLNTVNVESPGDFDMGSSAAPTGGGAVYSTYEIDITDAHPVTAGEIDILISVQCEAIGYGGLLPGAPVTSYRWYTTHVAGSSAKLPEWPLYHFNPESTGYNPAEDDLEPPLKALWSKNHGGGAIFFAPVVAEGKAFYVNCSSDTLRAVDWETGEQVWEQDVDPNNETTWGYWCGPAYHNGYIFAGGVNGYCFEAEDGDLEWEYQSSQHYVFGSVMVDDGVVFFPGRYGRLEAVDEVTGSYLWGQNTGDTWVGCFWITCGDELVYAGGSTSGEVYAREKLTGTGGWMTIGPDPGPTVYDDRSFRNAGAVDEYGDLYTGNYSRNMYKFDGDTGEILWTYPLNGREAFNANLIYDNCLFFGSVNAYSSQVPDEQSIGALYAVNLDGSERWVFIDPHDGLIRHDPVASGGYIWTAGTKGYIYAINPVTGALEWETQLTASAKFESGCAIAGNKLYLGDTGGTMYCLTPE